MQRMGPPHWPAYPAAARFEAAAEPERAARLAARLIAARSARGRNHRRLRAGARRRRRRHARRDRLARLFQRARARRRDGPRRLRRASSPAASLPVVKHIPGHGRAKADSHLELPVVAASRAELAARDFAPFAALARRADGDERARRLQRDRSGCSRHHLADRRQTRSCARRSASTA